MSPEDNCRGMKMGSRKWSTFLSPVFNALEWLPATAEEQVKKGRLVNYHHHLLVQTHVQM